MSQRVLTLDELRSSSKSLLGATTGQSPPTGFCDPSDARRGLGARRKPAHNDDGAAALEFALMLPVILIILAVMIGAGRLWIARSDALAVARSASRQAVLQPSASLAADAATNAGQEAAGGYGMNLARLTVNPQGPFGPGALYRVQVSYVVSLSDLPGLGFLPGSITVSTVATEPIDPNTAQ